MEGTGDVIFAALNGFNCPVKVPADCSLLFENMLDYLLEDFPGITERIRFIDDRLPPFDGVIGLNAFEGSGAVGYLDKWPNLLIYHKGCTVTLAGNEREDQLKKVSGIWIFTAGHF
ncbi:MAG: hypothetical protein IPH20_21725 [Bacteroidales bacterium]|nr:hypothetical protein [Bacteroidales bacterium]